jgi:hypothetical protein
VLPLPLLALNFPLLLAAFVLLGIGIGALDVSMNAHAVLVEERYGRPIMSSFHGLFSLGGLVGAALAGGAMQVGLPPAPHLVIAAVVLGASVLAAWSLLLPTAPAPAGGPLFVVPRGRLAAPADGRGGTGGVTSIATLDRLIGTAQKGGLSTRPAGLPLAAGSAHHSASQHCCGC